MRKILLATAAFAAVSVAAGAGTAMSVPIDEVRVMSFAGPVSTLYVGNPVIADVTIIDNRHAFVQGKAFGSTNIVAVDSHGRPVVNQQIVVSGKGSSVVTLQRGNQQTTYACAAARCQTTPQPGDGKDAFETAGQIEKYQNLSTTAAKGGSQ